jgi:hypothetical protein
MANFRDFEFWAIDDVAAWIKELNDGLGQIIATLQELWPDEDIFAPAPSEEIKGRVAIMIGGSNLSLVSPQVFLAHMNDSIAAKEPCLMALASTAREIVESGRYEKKLAIPDVLQVLVKHQEKWEERIEMLQGYQEGVYEENIKPLTEALQKVHLQRYRRQLINKWHSNEHSKELLADRKATPVHLHWQQLMRLEQYRHRDAIVEQEARGARHIKLSFRRWIKYEKRSRRQQVLDSIRWVRDMGEDYHRELRWEERIIRKRRLLRRISYWHSSENGVERRKEVLARTYLRRGRKADYLRMQKELSSSSFSLGGYETARRQDGSEF